MTRVAEELLWPDDDSLGPSSPPYSPQAMGSERVLSFDHPSDSVPVTDPFWSPTSFKYESSLVNVSLGKRLWDLRLPAYGFNSLVEGAVKLSRKCTHVVRVQVSVERPLFTCQCRVQLTNFS
jgi:hypothetical protein